MIRLIVKNILIKQMLFITYQKNIKIKKMMKINIIVMKIKNMKLII